MHGGLYHFSRRLVVDAVFLVGVVDDLGNGGLPGCAPVELSHPPLFLGLLVEKVNSLRLVVELKAGSPPVGYTACAGDVGRELAKVVPLVGVQLLHFRESFFFIESLMELGDGLRMRGFPECALTKLAFAISIGAALHESLAGSLQFAHVILLLC